MEHLERIENFEKLAFGLFIHWGLYSQLSRGEWTLYSNKEPGTVYGKLPLSFKADKFDGHALARFAREAGMKYITLTTRHHEGFSLYNTRGLSEYDALHSAAGRDLIKDFVEGCRDEGIIPFFYHTTLDWHQPLFSSDFDVYLEYLRKSVEVLCTNYGKIGGFWFDGNWSKPDADWHENELYSTIRKYQPDAIIVNNTGLQHRGEIGNPEIDSVTFENGLPSARTFAEGQKYVAGEMCATLNGHWGVAGKDFTYKPMKELIENLCACRKYRANYLLNIGLNADGSIPALAREMVLMIGNWIKLCGESIYEGKPCGVESGDWDFGLDYHGGLHLFIHNLHRKGSKHVVIQDGKEGPRVFTGVKRKVGKIRWLDSGEPLEFIQEGEQLTVFCTGYPYGINTVVRVAAVEFTEKETEY